ncbi:hypothetical protein M5689_012045 [Euphorbia peplus]|nr:hypothetical protein M5689_012045 [Euphorbia peplus]
MRIRRKQTANRVEVPTSRGAEVDEKVGFFAEASVDHDSSKDNIDIEDYEVQRMEMNDSTSEGVLIRASGVSQSSSLPKLKGLVIGLESISEDQSKLVSTSKKGSPVCLDVSDDESDKDDYETEPSRELLGPEDLAVIHEGYLRYQGYLKTLTKGASLLDIPVGRYLADMFMIPGEVDRLSDFSLGEFLSRNLTACASVSSELALILLNFMPLEYLLDFNLFNCVFLENHRGPDGKGCFQTP